MAYRLDVVAVGVENERAVIVRMILRTQTGSAVVASAGRNRGLVKVIDNAPLRRRKRDVSGPRRIALPYPEIGLPVLSETRRIAELHQQLIPKRRQRALEELLAARKVGYRQTNMIEHDGHLD